MEILSHPFVIRAILAAVGVSLVCAAMSFFVVLRKMAFVGAGVAHIAFGGVALALLLDIPVTAGATAAAVAAAVVIARVRRSETVSEDTMIGILFAVVMAFGIVCAHFGRATNVDLMAYLFGNVLTVTWTDVAAIGLFALVVLAILGLLFWPLVFVSFDEESARLARLPTGLLTLVLLLLIALTVALSIRTVGLLLVSALLVIPGATAQRVTDSVYSFLAVSLLVGLVSALAGLALSFAADLPSGASIVLVAGAVYAATALVGR